MIAQESIPTGSDLLDLVVGKNGYPVGRIINIIGDSAAGKCAKNAYVLTNNGFELLDTLIPDAEYGFTKYNNSVSVSGDVSEAKVDYFYKEKVNSTIYIRTRHGYEIEGTPNHLVMVWENGFHKMKRLGDITEKDTIIISYGTERYGNSHYLPEISQKNSDVQIPKFLSKDLALLLGYFVADGNFTKGFIALSNTKKWFVKNLERIVPALFDKVPRKKGNITSVDVVSFFKAIFGNPENFTARYKYIPDIIMKARKKHQASFLKGLIDCDSSCSYDSFGNISDIEYSTASQKLAKQVQLLLLNMGIITSTGIKHGAKIGDTFYDHDYYRVRITHNFINTYFNAVGSDKYKYTPIQGRYENSAVDSIPGISDVLKTARNGMRKNIGWHANGNSNVVVNGTKKTPKFTFGQGEGGFNLLKRFLETFKDYKEFFQAPYTYEYLQQILNLKYHYDSVNTIIVKDEETDVFDFHVPDTHLFWANGMVNHNTFIACEAVYQAKKKYGNKVHVRYNDAESGFTFDTEEMYGFDIREDMVQTPTIQEFAADLGVYTKNIKDDELGIYIIDSFDGLCSDADIEEFDARMKDYEKGDTYNKGTYDMSKQKYSSKLFRTLVRTIEDKNILLIIISQIRDNIGVNFGTKWTVSGGNALKFYSSVRLFLNRKEDFTKHDRGYGYCAQVNALKSRSKHPNRSCYVNFLYEYGMDNISSNVDFLFDLKDKLGKLDKAKAKALEWKEGADMTPDAVKEFLTEKELMDTFSEKYPRYSYKRALEFIESIPEVKNEFADLFGTMERESLIHYIEDNDLSEDLSERTIAKWDAIEDDVKQHRKKKRL